MRVEPAPPVPVDDLDPRAKLRQYLSAVRRRWHLVAALALLGGGLAWFTAPSDAASESTGQANVGPTYYRASHVLLVDGAKVADATSQQVNLAQAAYLVNTGEVPERVAEKLQISVEDVGQSILGLPRSQVNSVEVQAVSVDPGAAVQLADTAAAELLVVLDTQAKADAERERDQVLAQMEKLDGQINSLTDQISLNPPNRLQLEAQQRSLANQYSVVYEQFSQMANRPAAGSGLTSLEGAKAIQISKSAYDDLRETIRDGADYVTGATSPREAVDTEPSAPESPASRTTRAATGFLVGLFLGIGLALLLDRFDGRLRRREDVEAVTGLSVIAELPGLTRKEQQHQEVVAHTQHRSRVAEAYRVVRGAIMFAEQGETATRGARKGANVIMVTSANPAEGKTTVTANLAAVLAEGGLRVLVINCDFRRPRVHKYLVPDLESAAEDEPPRVLSETQIDRVDLISGVGDGDPEANPLDVVATQRKVIEMARPRYDVIVLDTAPFLTTNDASELLSVADHVLLVVRGGKTRREAAARTVEVLARFDAPVLGIVMNDSQESPAAQYYYGYGPDDVRRSERDRSDSDGGAVDLENARVARAGTRSGLG